MLNIAILSVNHHLATVAIREKVAFAQNELEPAISSLLSTPEISLEQSKDSIPVSKKPTNIHNS